MNFEKLCILLGLTLYPIQIEGVRDKIPLESLDSLKQWNDHRLICGFPSKKLSKDTFVDITNNFQNATGIVWKMNTINNSDTLEREDFPEMLNDEKNRSMRQINITKKNFECCLKNILMKIRTPEQRERCLASFFQCVVKTEIERCKVNWRFYMYLVLHDRRFIFVVVFVLACGTIAVMYSSNCCIDEYPTLRRDNFRRYSVNVSSF